ncbi:hypothetical protein [Variovorax sp. GB1P17]|uniref:hypothetical protein n=1 Tax=Variovorax sp. GB1P17 TaxID=3443740 RepID=UPI003F448010
MSRGKYRRRGEGAPAQREARVGARNTSAAGNAEPDGKSLAVALAKRWGVSMPVAHLLSVVVVLGVLVVGAMLVPGWPSIALFTWGEWGPKNYIDPDLSTAQKAVEAWPLLNIVVLACLFRLIEGVNWRGALIVPVAVTVCSWGSYRLGAWTSEGTLSDVINRWHPSVTVVHVARVVDRSDRWQNIYSRGGKRVTGSYPVYTVVLASWRRPGETITLSGQGVNHTHAMGAIHRGDVVLVDEHAGLLGRAWIANVRPCEPATCPP